MGVASFPQWAVSAIIVGASVGAVSALDSGAGWVLALIIVLSSLTLYPLARTRLTELVKLIGG